MTTKCNQLCDDDKNHDKYFKYNPEYVCKCSKGYNLANDEKTCRNFDTDRISNCNGKHWDDIGYCAEDKCVCNNIY